MSAQHSCYIRCAFIMIKIRDHYTKQFQLDASQSQDLEIYAKVLQF